MLTVADLTSIPVPRRLHDRPKDKRGFPITYVTLIDKEGVPDFRVIDEGKWVSCVRHRLCGLCGQKMDRPIAFIGGPQSHASHLFRDSAMHAECARYALVVCPFLALPKMRYSPIEIEHSGFKIETVTAVSTTRPDRFGLFRTDTYAIAKIGDEVVIRAGRWHGVEWYCAGDRLPDEPVTKNKRIIQPRAARKQKQVQPS